jgi:hypothetical protein
MAQALQADFLLSGVLNQSGQPNSGGWAIFYESDGSTLKSVFADSEKVATKTLNSNNGVDLDLNGSATVFLDGTYTVKIYDKNGVLLRTFSSLQFNPQDASSADYIEAKNYGSSNDGTRISLAVSDAAGADRTVYLAPANYAITSNLTIPSNINLKFEMGAFLTVSSGITVTINGSIEAPLYNIFRGSGTTTFDDRNNVVPSVWSSGTHDNLTLDGVVNVSDTLQLGGVSVTSTAAELNILDGVTATASELNILDGVTATASELNILDGVTATASELNILDGVTASTSELNILDGVTSTASELNILDGVTSTASELNLLDGSASGTIVNSKGVVYGSAGEVNMTSLEIAGLRSVPNLNVEKGYVYLSGAGNFECSQSATPGQSVQVDDRSSSTFYGSDGAVYVSANASVVTVSLTSSNASNPRWDLVELDASAGTYSVVDGTASANPTYPSGTAGKDAIAYVYRKASTAGNTIYDRDILDARISIKNKTVDGHFKTNFSINQKEDTENSYYDNQQMFQQVPFGTKFDYVQEDKTNLQYIDTILVPADSVNGEVVYSGTWTNSDSSSFFFGRIKRSSTAGSTAILSFSGVSCNIIYTKDNTSTGFFSVELSDDDGATYHSKKIFNTSMAGDYNYNNVTELYQGLEYGDYKVKVTILTGTDTTGIEGFSYATYLVQTPMTQKAYSASSSAPTIDDVPPLTTLFGGTWSYILRTLTMMWNGVFNEALSNNATVEYKFYGSSIYVSLYVSSSHNSVFSVEIDNGATYVKNSSISLPSYGAGQTVWVRLDNGSLPEGVHTVKLTTTTCSASQRYGINGWAHYSSKCPTACARSLICGKDSYAVGSDSTDFTYSGSWTPTDSGQSFLGRYTTTTTNNDYVTITTPTNVKAIYLITRVSSDRGELKISLGGASSNLRYINTDTDNYGQGSFIQVLYDSYMDGISLDSQELRITKNGGTTQGFEGIIFEIGDAVELDSIFCMPKWTRYNASSSSITPVSTSHRLDVYGSKSDGSTGRQPMVHSGFVYHSSGNYVHYRHGLNTQDMNYKYERGGPEAKVYHLDAGANNDLYNFYGDFGLISTGSYATNEWVRISLFPNRVI